MARFDAADRQARGLAVPEDVKAKLRSQVERLLTRCKYPSDRQPAAIELVLE